MVDSRLYRLLPGFLILILFEGVLAVNQVHAQTGTDNLQIEAVRIQGAITLDGKLDEQEWGRRL